MPKNTPTSMPENTQPLSINVIGPGAVGHLWACFLTQSGVNCRLYGKTNQANHRVHTQSTLGDYNLELAIKSLDALDSADATLICVKTYQLEQLFQQLCSHTQLATSKNPMILMMNGMGLVELARRYLPENKIIQASMTHGVFLDRTGHTWQVKHTGLGQTLLGNWQSNYQAEDFSALIQTLNQALPQVLWSNNHPQNLNLKLVINAIINPLTAIQQVCNGEILDHGKLNQDASLLLDELKPLLPELLPEMSFSSIKARIEKVAYDTRHNRSSMLQDLMAKRPSEIDYISGYLLGYAKRLGCSLPRHQGLFEQIKQQTATWS